MKNKNTELDTQTTEPTVAQHIAPPAHDITEAQAGIDELKDSYDNFLYVSKAFPNTNINSLLAKGKIYGLNPAPLKGGSRVRARFILRWEYYSPSVVLS